MYILWSVHVHVHVCGGSVQEAVVGILSCVVCV